MAIVDKLMLKLNPKKVIERSPFFDEEWYREKYGVKGDCAKHYLREGWLLDYDPSDRFSSKDYLINNPDIRGINPLLHYEVFGKSEGRRPFVPKQGKANEYEAEKIDIPYDRFFKEIEEKRIVSFDVFDTLVIRPFVKADDLFVYLEKEYALGGFCDARKRAEADAREKLRKEVNIGEIYDHIDERYRALRDAEIECEIRFCHANPSIFPIYKKAKELNKRVIATSDMYLDQKIVRQILEGSGYAMDAVYVSCDHNRTKGSGELFDHVLSEEKAAAGEMIHFGDNYISDYSEARRKNIDAYQTPKIVDQVLSEEENRPYLSFCRMHDDLPASIYLAQIGDYLCRSDDEPFFTKLGYLLGGPLVLSYLNFVCTKAKDEKIDRLLFVSRDGRCLKRIYEKFLFEEVRISCAYAYLSRACIYSAALSNHLTDDLKKILSIARIDLPQAAVYGSFEESRREYLNFQAEIDAWSRKRDKNLKRHLESISEGCSRLATVDMFSGNYTSQKGAMYYLNGRIVNGFYAGNFSDSDIRHESFGNRLLGMRDNLPVKMSEFLVTSCESPIIGVDESGNAIYEYPQDEERMERYEQIMAGIERYAADFGRLFKRKEIFLLSLEEWFDLADSYLKNCSKEDLDALSGIVDSENPISGNNDRTIGELIHQYRDKGY